MSKGKNDGPRVAVQPPHAGRRDSADVSRRERNLTRTAARLPGAGFTAVQASSHIEYDFNSRSSLLGFVQYTNEDRRVDFNIRFHWIPVIGDDVFVVWNSGYSTNRAARYRFPSTSALTRQLNGALVLKVIHRLAP